MPKLNEPFRDNPIDQIVFELPIEDGDPDLPPPPDETGNQASSPKIIEAVCKGKVIPSVAGSDLDRPTDKSIGEEPDIGDPDLPPPPDETQMSVPIEDFSLNFEEIKVLDRGAEHFDFVEIRGSGSEGVEAAGLEVIVAAATTETAKPEWEEIDDYTAELLPDWVRGADDDGSIWDGIG